ncbi:MAG: 2-oxoglutarate dehydrogenase E1 component, partial [Rhodocyclaceae bacterium]|nr:2-oxoglutarate dehydrogenase E1 component [Rhodocyclaceae bacterium]
TGRVYYDLMAMRRERKLGNVAVMRVEQLYPFDDRRLAEELAKFPNFKSLVWCQEEPENQGAWYAKHHRLSQLVKKGQTLSVVSRPASSSPAVGYAARHQQEQKDVVLQALGIDKPGLDK